MRPAYPETNTHDSSIAATLINSSITVSAGENDSLNIKIPYNPVLIAKIKQIPYSTWNAKKKLWVLPRTPESLRLLQEKFNTEIQFENSRPEGFSRMEKERIVFENNTEGKEPADSEALCWKWKGYWIKRFLRTLRKEGLQHKEWVKIIEQYLEKNPYPPLLIYVSRMESFIQKHTGALRAETAQCLSFFYGKTAFSKKHHEAAQEIVRRLQEKTQDIRPVVAAIYGAADDKKKNKPGKEENFTVQSDIVPGNSCLHMAAVCDWEKFECYGLKTLI